MLKMYVTVQKFGIGMILLNVFEYAHNFFFTIIYNFIVQFYSIFFFYIYATKAAFMLTKI